MVLKYLFTRTTLKQVVDNGDFDYDTVLFVQAHIKQSWFLWNGSDRGGEGVISGLSGSLIGVSLSSVHCFPILADHLNPQIEMEWICPLPILTLSIVYICL